MSYRDVYIAEEAQEQRLQERLDRAATSRLARQIRPQHWGWLSQRLVQLLHRVGHRLLAVGAQPEPSKRTRAGLIRETS